MSKFLVFWSLIFYLQSVEFVFIPDDEQTARTLFVEGDVPDYKGASLWNKVKFLLNYNGHNVRVSDLDRLLSEKKRDHLQIVIWNRSRNHSIEKLNNFDPKILSLIVFEPPSVLPNLHSSEYYACFSKVLTWEDDIIDQKKFFKYHHPVCYPMIKGIIPFQNRKLCTIMAANKKSKFKGEIYSERRSAIDYFDKFPDQFDLYGPGWGKEVFESYKGVVNSKIDTLMQYKFSICFENTSGMNGYITEKIFDCMCAGVIPVYLGAPNISDEVPRNCFIDKRDFSSYKDLHSYMLSISRKEFQLYLENMGAFLLSKEAVKYTLDGFALAIVNGLTGLNLSWKDLPD